MSISITIISFGRFRWYRTKLLVYKNVLDIYKYPAYGRINLCLKKYKKVTMKEFVNTKKFVNPYQSKRFIQGRT